LGSALPFEPRIGHLPEVAFTPIQSRGSRQVRDDVQADEQREPGHHDPRQRRRQGRGHAIAFPATIHAMRSASAQARAVRIKW